MNFWYDFFKIADSTFEKNQPIKCIHSGYEGTYFCQGLLLAMVFR